MFRVYRTTYLVKWTLVYLPLVRRCSGALRLIQDFLGRPKDLVAAEMALSPALCDQKRAELLLYKLLNQVDSPAARMKVRQSPRR